MARSKFDGVIEAVRYDPEGKIALVTAYERHGAVWSDHVLLNREELIKRLNQHKRFVIGRRKAYLGGVFETGQRVRLVKGVLITDGQTPNRDNLASVPIF
jgi:hypothetical protein